MPGPVFISQLLTEQMVLAIGNADGPPETFTAPATINADRSVEFTANAKAVEVPQVGLAGPMKTMRTVVSTDSKATGAGALHAGDLKTWVDWLIAGTKKNIQISNAATGALVAVIPCVLTQLTETGSQQGELVTVQITLEQADAPTITAHA